MSATETVEAVTRPDVFLESVDMDERRLCFSKIDIPAFRQASFMDKRLETLPSSGLQIGIDAALGSIHNAADRDRKVNFILHTSFCCSTLLAKCLDIDGVSITLREPGILMQLANYKRTGHPGIRSREEFIELLELALYYLPHTGNRMEYAAIKPTNTANNLAEEFLDCRNSGKVLLLYSSLKTYLISVIKKGETGRRFVRRVFGLLHRDEGRLQHLPMQKIMQLTDLQLAALVWHVHMDHFLALLARELPEQDRIRTLDCDDFLATPAAALRALVAHFGYAIEAATIDEIILGPVFSRYSKDPGMRYTNMDRDKEYLDLLRRHEDEIAPILAWSDEIRPDGPLKLPLPRPLL